MEKQWTENELKEIAKQLGNPTGDGGIKTAEMMNLSNHGMIATTVALLDIQNGDNMMEIGPGNGKHVPSLMDSHENLKYTGLDISETMINEAHLLNSKLVLEGKATFVLSNGKTIPFAENSFDKIFTVNTVYFWKNPNHYAAEIYRVLKPNGVFNLALATKTFMEKLPFTAYGFKLYSKSEALTLLTDAGFAIIDAVEQVDITVGRLGQPVERDIIIIKCTKDSL